METRDYYSILEIERSASGADIKTAYRRLAQRFHPDVSDDADGERKFKAVAEAYRTLKVVETRTAYDRRAVPRDGNGDSGVACAADSMHVWCALLLWPGWIWIWLR